MNKLTQTYYSPFPVDSLEVMVGESVMLGGVGKSNEMDPLLFIPVEEKHAHTNKGRVRPSPSSSAV
jgi:hypothetical protein